MMTFVQPASLLCGIAFVVSPLALAGTLGIPFPLILYLVGFALIGYALGLFLLATREAIRTGLAITATLLDSGWVIGSAILLFLPDMPFTASGRVVVAVLAILVAGFALAQALVIVSKAKSHA